MELKPPQRRHQTNVDRPRRCEQVLAKKFCFPIGI